MTSRTGTRCAIPRSSGSWKTQPHAGDIARLSRQELQDLLDGSPAEQDLLGLLAAARGGLSGPDLEELTGIPLWDIERILHTVGGRTFLRQVNSWTLAASPEAYVLGHEELQVSPRPATSARGGWRPTRTACTPGPGATATAAGPPGPRSTCWAATSGC